MSLMHPACICKCTLFFFVFEYIVYDTYLLIARVLHLMPLMHPACICKCTLFLFFEYIVYDTYL